jgi:hypothetical protein
LCWQARWLPDKTNKKTIEGYKNFYEGPELDVDNQYAQIWILCTMAFFFGPLLPVIFIYCLVGLVILSVTNKLKVAYSCKRIPNFDQTMNGSFLIFMHYFGPVMYFLVAGILYSNEQVFENKAIPNKSSAIFFATNDAYYKSLQSRLTQINPWMIYFFFGSIWLVKAAYEVVCHFLLWMDWLPDRFYRSGSLRAIQI